MVILFIAYLCTAGVFLAVDYLWLGFVAKKFYAVQLDHLMADQVNLFVAGGFYLVYAIGVVIFAVTPALENNQWTHAAIYGALFGFFCYATYDFTNQATLKNWPVIVTVVDVSWGTILTTLSATLGYFLTRMIMPA